MITKFAFLGSDKKELFSYILFPNNEKEKEQIIESMNLALKVIVDANLLPIIEHEKNHELIVRIADAVQKGRNNITVFDRGLDYKSKELEILFTMKDIEENELTPEQRLHYANLKNKDITISELLGDI